MLLDDFFQLNHQPGDSRGAGPHRGPRRSMFRCVCVGAKMMLQQKPQWLCSCFRALAKTPDYQARCQAHPERCRPLCARNGRAASPSSKRLVHAWKRKFRPCRLLSTTGSNGCSLQMPSWCDWKSHLFVFGSTLALERHSAAFLRTNAVLPHEW